MKTHILAGSLLLSTSPALMAQSFVVNTTEDTVDAKPGDGLCADSKGRCSLRAAFQEASALGGTIRIDLAECAIYRFTLTGAGEDAGATGDLDLSTATVTLNGNHSSLFLDADDRAFDVFGNASLTINELAITGGAVEDASGGAIRSAGTLPLDEVEVRRCVALGKVASGGALFNDGGRLVTQNSYFIHCVSERAGGAIEANGGETHVSRSYLLANLRGPTPGNGGGFHLSGTGEVSFDRCSIESNVASSEGGGLWNSSTGQMQVNNCEIRFNYADGTAADNGGGGIFNDGGMLQMQKCTLDGNRSVRAGGGVEADEGETLLLQVKFSDNVTGSSHGNGGGLHLAGAGTVTIDRGSFQKNLAANEGGALWNSSRGTMTVTNTKFKSNHAPTGPTLFHDGGTLTVNGQNVPPGGS